MDIFETLVTQLKEKGLTLGSVESMTAGGFAFKLTSVPGASKVFKGSIVTYATELKTKIVDVDDKIIKNEGVVSSSVAKLMAKGGKEKLSVDICVSITGNAGPSKCEGNGDVGDIFIGISFKDTQDYYFNLNGDRNTIREKAITKMAEIVLENITNN